MYSYETFMDISYIHRQKRELEKSIKEAERLIGISMEVSAEICKENVENICIVGVHREIDVKVENTTDHWILCTMLVSLDRDCKSHIELENQLKMMMLPRSSKIVKVGVKVLKFDEPIPATFKARMEKLPSRAIKTDSFKMRFVPEELNIIVDTESGKNELDFQTTPDSSSKTLFVRLENKNSVEVPLRLSLENNSHKRFQLDYDPDHPNSEGSLENDVMCLTLNPSQEFKSIIRCNGTLDTDGKGTDEIATDEKVNESDDAMTILSVRIHNENTDLLIKEIPVVYNVPVQEKTVLCPESSNDVC